MGQTEPAAASFQSGEMTRMVKHNHMHIMTLFQEYLHSPTDSRHAIQEQILRQLASHLDTEREFLFQKTRNLSPQSQRIVGEAEVESEGIKAMILALQHSKGDDDQARDEFFEDMMQSVRVLFMTEERDLLPLIAGS